MGPREETSPPNWPAHCLFADWGPGMDSFVEYREALGHIGFQAREGRGELFMIQRGHPVSFLRQRRLGGRAFSPAQAYGA